MEYAVVLYFDNDTMRAIDGYIALAADVSGNRYMTDHRIPPHVTVAMFRLDDIPESIMPALDALTELSRTLQSGDIQLVSVDSLPPNVIYLKPALDAHLLETAAAIWSRLDKIVSLDPLYLPPRWAPHAAVAVKLSQPEYDAALPELQKRFAPVSGKSARLGLAKCNPYQGLVAWTL